MKHSSSDRDKKRKKKIFIIAGSRPNFVKIAAVINALDKKKDFFEYEVIHTGQHYDYTMSQIFFKEFHIKAFVNLGIRSDRYPFTTQISLVKKVLRGIFAKERPDFCLVVGDCNSAVGGALAGSSTGIPVIHVEAGLRSFDRRMAEESNRLIIDLLSDYLFASEPSAVENLKKEGTRKGKVFFVGNVMIDTLLKYKKVAMKLDVPRKLNLKNKDYAVLTLHRPENVDQKSILQEILEAVNEIQKKIRIIWLLHPRTRKQMEKFNLLRLAEKMGNLKIVPPLGYLEMLSLTSHSKFVLTDSGGLQEETTFLGVPCLTLRNNTERPVTTLVGTNKIAGLAKENIIKESIKIINGDARKGRVPALWDGKASERIVKILLTL